MNRIAIEQLLPHRGTALWLDTVTQLNADSISGQTVVGCLGQYDHNGNSHLLYEAAAQLCAVHGARHAGSAKSAYVAKVQQLQIHQHYSATLAVTVRCQLLSQNQAGALYQFNLYQNSQLLLSGNLLVVIEYA
ncbi:hypothetical protein [Rheinheimera maricola]|uniref:Hydroxymyristoyl-ACP dehydratase n=1 Tax=Rheinheimera maricola TaxID=2793282 RepID=A0ABS7XDB3_9GAMM|nr:hypothetical protein [Rheinheimera maricola]MBZ9613050.1 hypothetical protein [Rheinheimera maricola]